MEGWVGPRWGGKVHGRDCELTPHEETNVFLVRDVARDFRKFLLKTERWIRRHISCCCCCR
jgi:hypothetical protein